MNLIIPIQWVENSLLPWMSSQGIKIVLIISAAFIINYFLQRLIEKAIRVAVVSNEFTSKEAEQKRENTLIQVSKITIRFVIWVIAIMMIIQLFGVKIGPVLAAAGIVGLAVGFGGQYLIRDVISGIFIIIENQYRIGDVVGIDSIRGTVESITLRKTTLRDIDGIVYHVPHGEIKIVANLSKEFARINLNIGVSYNCDINKIINVVNQVGEDLANDPEWKDSIVKPPRFLRIHDLADSAVIIKILGDTVPLKQWELSGELRKRILIAFREENIEIPFPQLVVYDGAKSKIDQNL